MNKDEMIKDLTSLIDSYEIKTLANAQFVASQIVEKCNYRKVADDEIVFKKSEYKVLLLEQKRLKEIVDRIPCGYELKEITKKETAKEIIAKIEHLADIEIRKNSACEKYFDMVLDLLDKELED